MKPCSVWEAHRSSLAMEPSSIYAVCNHECSSTSLAKCVLRPSVGEKHAHPTSPAADPLGNIIRQRFEGNRVWGEDGISEEEIRKRQAARIRNIPAHQAGSCVFGVYGCTHEPGKKTSHPQLQLAKNEQPILAGILEPYAQKAEKEI